MSHEVDPVLEGLTETQLKDVVVKNAKEIFGLRADAKAYAKGVRGAVKALEDRSEDALELIELKKTDQAGM